MKLLRILLALLLSSCATITHDSRQRIIVSTPGAPKATCVLNSPTLGSKKFTTPEAIYIPRKSETIEVSCHKKCFSDASKIFNPVKNTEDLAMNGIAGGLPGASIDIATGKANNYPYEFTINMELNHRCKKSSKGFLDGDPKDFDSHIDDFKFDEPQNFDQKN